MIVALGVFLAAWTSHAGEAAADVNARINSLFGQDAARRYEPFIKAFQTAVRHNDAARVSRFIQYPIIVTRRGKSLKLSSAKSLLTCYPQIFTPELRAAIISQNYETLFVNWQGVMFGNGAVWISEIVPHRRTGKTVLKVTAIHLDALAQH